MINENDMKREGKVLAEATVGIGNRDDNSSLCVYHNGQDWLNDTGLDMHDDFQEVLSIYHSLADNDDGYGYKLEEQNGTTELSSYGDIFPRLVLSEGEKTKFLDYLDEYYGMPIDAYDSFRRAMEKDD